MSRILLLLVPFLATCLAYNIPQPQVVILSPTGFQVSIPDEPGMRLFVFNGNLNHRFNGSQPGSIRGDVREATNGLWTYRNTNVKLVAGDVLHYWVYVQHENLAYRLYDQQFSETSEHGTDYHIDVRNSERPICKPTITRVNGGQTVCSGNVIFEENFNDLTKWSTEVRIPPDTEFVAYQDFAASRQLVGGRLEIRPQVRNETSADQLDFGDQCTSNLPEECKREVFSFIILPPIVSSRIHTKDNFSFRYGRVEVRAKLPKGDWIFPDILIEHRPSAAEQGYAKIRVAFIRSNRILVTEDNIEIGGRVLYGGIEPNLFVNTSMTRHLSDDFHLFTATWTDVNIRFEIDGELYGIVPTDTLPNSDDEYYYLSLGVGVGGVKHFPDSSRTGVARTAKPWTNDDPKAELNFKENYVHWQQTWNSESALSVDYIRVYAI